MRVTYIPIVLHILEFIWLRVEGQSIAHVNNLSTILLTGYNRNTRPVNDQTSVLTVSVSAELIAITDFNEVKGKLSTVMAFELSWFDEGMVWDVAANNNIDRMIMSQVNVWKPMLTLSNPYDDLDQLGDDDWVTVSYLNNGEASWSPLTKLDTTCSIDTTYYPFDTQQCEVTMMVFGYGSTQVALVTTQSTVSTTYYEDHATWSLASSSVEVTLSSSLVYFLTLTFEFERLADFAIVNFLVPMLFLAGLNPLVFVLPTDTGTRLGFAMTIMLSLSVFLTILADFIPKNSDPMSLLTYMLMILYIWSTTITVVVILNGLLYGWSDSKTSNKWTRGFVRLCRGQCFKNRIKSTGSTAKNDEAIRNKTPMTIHVQHDTKAEPEENSDDITWNDVASAIDKIACAFMYLFLFVTILAFQIVLRKS